MVLVDDHAVVRSGLAQLLDGAGDIEVVGQAGDGREAVVVVRETRPDVVVMDLQMPGMDGVEATRQILGEELGAEVVVLTSFSDSARIVAALDAGAVGYLLKDADPEDVLDGVRAVSRGESPIHPKVARRLLTARSETSAAAVQLTKRETEVLALVRAGLANKQIGRRLGISERTVKAHLTSVFQQIGVVDRTQAALWAERNLPEAGRRGLVDVLGGEPVGELLDGLRRRRQRGRGATPRGADRAVGAPVAQRAAVRPPVAGLLRRSRSPATAPRPCARWPAGRARRGRSAAARRCRGRSAAASTGSTPRVRQMTRA